MRLGAAVPPPSPAEISRLSLRAVRLAGGVPPTPPPSTTTRFMLDLPRLLDHDLVVAVLVEHADEVVAGLLDPLGDVGLAALVAGQHREDVATPGLLHAPDELHQGPRAEAAARVDGGCDGGFGGLGGHGRVLSEHEGPWRGRETRAVAAEA